MQAQREYAGRWCKGAVMMNPHRFTAPQVFDHETNPEAFPNMKEASEHLKSLPVERRRELEEEWHG